MNTVSNYNAPVLAQIYTLLNDSVRYLIRSKFEERLLVLVAAATTIVQKPMFEAAEKVRTQVEEKFAGSCESNTCRDFLAVNAKQLSQRLSRELAANGASADQIDSAVIESEQEIVGLHQAGFRRRRRVRQAGFHGHGTIILGVLGLGALSSAGFRAYQHKPILPKSYLPDRTEPFCTVPITRDNDHGLSGGLTAESWPWHAPPPVIGIPAWLPSSRCPWLRTLAGLAQRQ